MVETNGRVSTFDDVVLDKDSICCVDVPEDLKAAVCSVALESSPVEKSLSLGDISTSCVVHQNMEDISELGNTSAVVGEESHDVAVEESGDSSEDADQDHSGDVVINRVRSVTVKAPISISGQSVKAVVDTGAEVTVMSHRVFESIPAERRPVLKATGRCLVNAEDGKRMKTQGMIETTVEIGDLCFNWPLYVAPIGDDMLL